MAFPGMHSILKDLADQAMNERGLDASYSGEALQQIRETKGPAEEPSLPDLCELPWCSIDNGEGDEVTSKDLDQITAAEAAEDGAVRVYVAIADVDALVPKDCPVDEQASRNTATVYTAAKNYPMIDPQFSEGWTSLNEGESRLAIVTDFLVYPGGKLGPYQIRRAIVLNKCKLNYEAVGGWLEGKTDLPTALHGRDDLQESLRLQDRVAQQLKARRRAQGSLELASLEARAKTEGDQVTDVKGQLKNRATDLIENLMVACNGIASEFLREQGMPTMQRVVRRPKFWDRIVELAGELQWNLPEDPDSKALQKFLESRRKKDPERFPDLSLQVLKLLGRGEYVVETPGEPMIGHFGLAVREYSHSTAPNRRYPDLITQRLLKAALAGQPCPYELEELEELARHCSDQEAASDKVQRQTAKSAAALYLQSHIGEKFEAVVSGENQKSTWVRLLSKPIEGLLDGGHARIGQRLTVKLVSVNVERGFIDFRPVHHHR